MPIYTNSWKHRGIIGLTNKLSRATSSEEQKLTMKEEIRIGKSQVSDEEEEDFGITPS
jgi:hypothetical protein